MARVGSHDQAIIACSIEEMANTDLGKPLHSLVIPAGNIHPLEEDYIKQFRKV